VIQNVKYVLEILLTIIVVHALQMEHIKHSSLQVIIVVFLHVQQDLYKIQQIMCVVLAWQIVANVKLRLQTALHVCPLHLNTI
jgi:hypothetical protein